MRQENVTVLWNRPIRPFYYKIGLRCSEAFAGAQPGQFVMLHLPDQIAPLLRRPFSIHRPLLSGKTFEGIEILYKVAGEGTRKLAACREHDGVNILGPLGNGFLIPDTARRIVLVAGGIGVAPLYFLAMSLRQCTDGFSGCRLLLGGRSADDLLCKDDFIKLGMPISVITDDGSEGDRGLVTDLLETGLINDRPDLVCACGPLPMLKKVARLAIRCSVTCLISLESHMACGIGACLGCAVEAADSSGNYYHVCKDGPVFDASLLKL
ncbi:MAG: dihydroorotate dehydrogenase electron transfer subunit [Desulfobacterales bacterium]|nr:dihydroorotate dehydrogenase electron transfer subunit [Desulfobacterales bacterium]MDD4071206.1 dihydroorotate dehydrogenase electron transfer subunit [Desulfobacterales bacterium]MDD4392214.1 dihydroorotate dehydrogenase electron transfer subunit [Desulfobacterales bacterium]